MKIFISATERSADLHAFHLIKSLKEKMHNLEICGVMGDLNTAESIWIHNSNLNVMGFSDVIPKIPKILKILKILKNKIKEERPDCIVLIDSPDFNLRLASRIKEFGIPIIYYICPQVWAWRKKRIYQLKKMCHVLIPILPFEPAYYKKFGVEVTYCGHPILDEQSFTRVSKDKFIKMNQLPMELLNREWIAIFPGSRKGELDRHLPVLEKFVKEYKGKACFILATVNKLNLNWPNTYELAGIGAELFSVVDRAFVKSGTSSLQAALYGVPSLIFYRVSLLNQIIFNTFIKYKGYVSLPNLILNKEIFPELLQEDFNTEKLEQTLSKLPVGIENEKKELINLLGTQGCSNRVAETILNVVKTKKN